MENTKRDTLISIVVVILAAISVITPVRHLAQGSLYAIIPFLSSLLAVFYALLDYKKPHGNVLKVAMLLFAFSIMFSLGSFTLHRNICKGIEVMLITYIAGRLYNFKENKVLGVVVMILLIFDIIERYVALGDGFVFISYFRQFPTWCALFLAYIYRYKAHIEAGLADKAETIVKEN